MRVSLFAALAAGLAASACAMTVTEETTEEPAAAREEPLAGGWMAADREDVDVKAAEAMALDAIYTEHPTRALVDSVSAEAQVVAGMNYRFRVEMTGAPEFRKIFVVTVYQDLDGAMAVTQLEQVQGQ